MAIKRDRRVNLGVKVEPQHKRTLTKMKPCYDTMSQYAARVLEAHAKGCYFCSTCRTEHVEHSVDQRP
jgi:hypothetical protein